MASAPRTIRVFLSSTFRDMHAERDYLNRHVFPELRQRCLARGVEFVAIDLRWGLTEEQTDLHGALRLCLEEVERCRPFFVALVGDRYGWVPTPEEISQDFFEQVRLRPDLSAVGARLIDRFYHLDTTSVPPVYRLSRERPAELREAGESLVALWTRARLPHVDLSVTVREIGRAMTKGRFMNAMFYLRQPGPGGITRHPDFPSAFLPVFQESKPDRQRLADLLKENLRARHGQPGVLVREYQAEYAGLVLDPELPENAGSLGTVRLDGMETLGQMVLDDLWQAIEIELGQADGATGDTHQRERAGHERFVRDRSRMFFGRSEILEKLHAYSDGPETTPLVVIGPPGSGKSALLARFVVECRQRSPELLVVPHFIGAVPGTTRLAGTLRSLLATLHRECGFDEELPEDARLLRTLLAGALQRAATVRPVLVVIDAVNQLDPAERAHSLDWLPTRLPPGVHLIVSTLPGDCAEVLRRRVDDSCWALLDGLPEADRHRLAQEHLRLRGKQLTPDQLGRLLDTRARPDAVLPLYLLTALEEACLFGNFEALDERLKRFPATVAELFAQVFARLEQDHGRELVEYLCQALAVSRAGLTETELLDLLCRRWPDFAPAHWRRLYRALQFYLRPMDEREGSGLIAFFHEQIRLAAFRRYLEMESGEKPSPACRQIHTELARVFESLARCAGPERWRREQPRALSELTHHRIQSCEIEHVEELLLDLFFLEAKVEAGLAYELTSDFAEAAELFSAGDERRRVLPLLGELFGASVQFIAQHPETLFQCAWNLGWWYDCAEAAGHYLAPEGGWPAEGPPWTRPVLAPLLERWRAAKEQVHPGFPWVRSLRPPRDPLGSVRRMEFRGHVGGVSCLAVSPDGLRLASGCGSIMARCEPGVRTWDLLRGEVLAHIQTANSGVAALAFSPDGQRLATAGALAGACVQTWDVASARELIQFGGTGVALVDVAFSVDGRHILAADYRTVLVWDAESGEPVGEMASCDRQVVALGWGSDGLRIACLSDRGQVLRVCLASTGEEIAHVRLEDGRSASPAGVAFTSDGKGLVSFQDGLLVWNHLGGETIRVALDVPLSEGILALSPDGQSVALATWEGIQVLRWRTANLTCRIEEQLAVRSLCFSADGRLLAVGCDDGAILILDAQTGVRISDMPGNDAQVTALAFSPDQRQLIAGTRSGGLIVWNIEGSTHQSLPGFHYRAITAILFSVDCRWCYSAGADMEVRQWDATTWAEITQVRTHQRSIRRLVVCPEGVRLVTGADLGGTEEDGTFRLTDALTGRDLACFRGHRKLPTDFAFSSDRSLLVSGSEDGTIRVWRVTDGGLQAGPFLHSSGAVRSVAFSPDGRRVASGGEDATVRVWDLHSETEVASVRGEFGAVLCLRFLAGGERLLGGCGDSSLRIWEPARTDLPPTLRDETMPLVEVALTLSGDRLITVGSLLRSPDLGFAELPSGFFPSLPDNLESMIPSDVLTSWDPIRGNVQAILPGLQREVVASAFSSDGVCLATSAGDGTVLVRDAESGNELASLVLSESCVSWPVFGAETGNGTTETVVSLAFSSDNRHLVAGTSSGWIQVWDWQRGEELACFKAESASAIVAWTPEGSCILSASRTVLQAFQTCPLAVHVWSLEGDLLDEWTHPLRSAAITAITALDERRVVAAGSLADGQSLLIGWERGSACQVWYGTFHGNLRTLKQGNGRVLVEAVGGGPVLRGGMQATGSADVKAWDRGVSFAPRLFSAGPGAISCLAFSEEGRLASASNEEGSVTIWDVHGRQVNRCAVPEVVAVSWFRDGRLLSASGDGTLRVWDSTTGAELGRFGGSDSPLTEVALSPDGKQVAMASEQGIVHLWDTTTGARQAVLEAPGDIVCSVAFAPDGRHIVGSGFASVWTWNVQDGMVASHFPLGRLFGEQHLFRTQVRLSPDGTRLAVCNVQSFPTGIVVCDPRTGEVLSWVSPCACPIGGFAWSAEGQWLVMGGESFVQVCRANEKTMQCGTGADLQGCSGRVTAVAASSLGLLAAGHEDGTVEIWSPWELMGSRERAWCQGAEIVFEFPASRADRLHFPAQLERLTRDASGRTWAGTSGSHLLLLRIEGV